MAGIAEFASDVIAAVKGHVSRALEPLSNRLDQIEAAVSSLKLKEGPAGKDGVNGADGISGKDGAPGRDGIDGKDGIHGKDGAAGLDGKDGAPGVDGVPGKDGGFGERGLAGEKGLDGINGKDGLPGDRGERGVDGKDGRDGREGKDGAPGRDAAALEILPGINVEKSYPAGTWASHAGGLWLAKAMTDGMAGWHCEVDGLASIEITGGEDGRNFAVKAVMASGKETVLPFSVPTMLDRGVWREGQEYQKGDTVSFGGSGFICQRTTTDKPETSDAWRLAVKRGRDGKDFGKK